MRYLITIILLLSATVAKAENTILLQCIEHSGCKASRDTDKTCELFAEDDVDEFWILVHDLDAENPHDTVTIVNTDGSTESFSKTSPTTTIFFGEFSMLDLRQDKLTATFIFGGDGGGVEWFEAKCEQKAGDN